MVGDADAVTVLEMAHRRQLISAGALHVDSLLLLERLLPRGADIGDVCKGDLVLFSVLHFSKLDSLGNC